MSRVKTDLNRIVKQWEQNDRSSVSLTFVPPSTTTDSLPLVAEAIDAANAHVRSISPDPTSPGWVCTEPWPGPRGPVFVATIADSAQALEHWAAAFANALEPSGLDGHLTTETSDFPEMKSVNVTALSAVVALTGWRPAADHSTTPGWIVDEALGARVLDWATGWVADGDQSLHVGLGLSMSRRPRTAVPGLLAAATHPNSTPQLINSPDLEHVRQVSLSRNGHVIVQLRDVDRTWQERLDELRNVVTTFADVCDFGLVRHAQAGQISITGVISGYPAPKLPVSFGESSPATYYESERYLDGTHVPDAYGLQVLGDEHLSRISNLEGWRVAPVTKGRHLVEAADASVWFADEAPDTSVVQRARGDFGEAILWNRPPRQPNPELP